MSGRAPTLAHRLEYTLFRIAAAAAGLLGDGAAGRLLAAAGRLAYTPLGIRRAAVEAHLRRAFADRDAAWIRRTAAAAYAHLGREGAALIRLAALDRDRVLARTEVEGLDAFRAALGGGRGLVLVTGHLGNWEIGGAALAARGIPIDVVAQRQSNPLFDRAIVAARERLGMRVIERGRATREGLRALRAGRVVALVADQDARRAGVFVPFFGHPASTHRGPALLALRTGAPLFLGTALRTPAGGYHVRLEPVEVDRSGESEDVVRRLTEAFTARLEAAIRAAPDQYFWHHRRWKTRPPEEPAAGEPGITAGPETSGRRPRG
ncbi:MAG TPA: lysophospholipid acyltransferase family protein [Longimicrobiales bacterium]